MSAEENKHIVRRTFEEVFNQGNLALADSWVAATFVNHATPAAMLPELESLKEHVVLLRTTFPDLHFTTGYREHQFGLKTTLEGLKEDIHYLRTGFPDFHLTIENCVADADTVWILMTARGTNRGHFMGPPTGKPITITVMDVCRFENGKIVEHWGVPDRFAVLAQLGLLPQSTGEKS